MTAKTHWNSFGLDTGAARWMSEMNANCEYLDKRAVLATKKPTIIRFYNAALWCVHFKTFELIFNVRIICAWCSCTNLVHNRKVFTLRCFILQREHNTVCFFFIANDSVNIFSLLLRCFARKWNSHTICWAHLVNCCIRKLFVSICVWCVWTSNERMALDGTRQCLTDTVERDAAQWMNQWTLCSMHEKLNRMHFKLLRWEHYSNLAQNKNKNHFQIDFCSLHFDSFLFHRWCRAAACFGASRPIARCNV